MHMKLKICASVVLLGLASIGQGLGQMPGKAEFQQLFQQAATVQPGGSLGPFRRLETLSRESISRPALRRELELLLTSMLQPRASYEARLFACKQLAVIGSPSSLPAVAELLDHDDTAAVGCLALSTWPSDGANEALRRALAGAKGTRRIQILNTLGDRRDSGAIDLLTEAAKDPDPATAAAGIAALGKVGNPQAASRLMKLTSGATDHAQAKVADALLACAAGLERSGHTTAARDICEKLVAPSQTVHVRRAALDAWLRCASRDQAQQRILEVTHGHDDALKPTAIAAVRRLRGGGVSERFARELRSLPAPEQALLLDSLAARGDPPARAALVEQLAATELVVRLAAVAGLGRAGDASSIPALTRALATATSPEDLRALGSALGELPGGKETDRAVAAAFGQCEVPARIHLIPVLAARLGPEANPLLLRQAQAPETEVARAAWHALANTVTAQDAESLTGLLLGPLSPEIRPDAEAVASRALAKVEETARRSFIVRSALGQAQTAESRNSLLGLLPVCGDLGAFKDLRDALAASDSGTRGVAARALADWPTIAAWDDLAAIYRDSPDPALRGIVLRGLVRLAGEGNAHPDESVVARYRQLTSGARDDADRKLILGTLSGAAHPGALDLALDLLSERGVRAEAEAAVKRIAESIKTSHPKAAAAALERLKVKE